MQKNKKTYKVGIIGRGCIGKVLFDRLVQLGHQAQFIDFPGSDDMPRHERFNAEIWARSGIDAIFLAIPTLDQGQPAFEYISKCAQAKMPIITCEKGALAYHSRELTPYLSYLGYSASVGGGTRMLNYLKGQNIRDRKAEIYIVLNGTLNFVFDQLGQGRTISEACSDAIKLGYAEPGASDPTGLINGELRDVAMKICILFNTVILNDSDNRITPDQIRIPELSRDDISRLTDSGDEYRMLVSLTYDMPVRDNAYYGKSLKIDDIDGWTLEVGFRKIIRTQQLPYTWLPRGVANMIRICLGDFTEDGRYVLCGPGAGPRPTTAAMIADFDEMMQLR